MSTGQHLRGELQDKSEKITTLRECSEFLDDLSGRIDNLYAENLDIPNFISAMSGFIEDFNESDKMRPEEFRRLCIIVLETLFYE